MAPPGERDLYTVLILELNSAFYEKFCIMIFYDENNRNMFRKILSLPAAFSGGMENAASVCP